MPTDLADLTKLAVEPADPIEERKFELYINDLQNYIERVSDLRNREDLNQLSIKLRSKYYFNKLQDKWQRELGYTAQEIDGHIKAIQTPETDFQSSMSLKEVLKYGAEVENKWLVPNLLRKAGMYILAGAPKAGKSLLMYFLMHSIATGSQFLDRAIKPGKVLYIQLEEPLDTISERFQLTGFGGQDVDSSLVVNFTDHIMIEREFDATTDLLWLRNRIEEYRPSLVVIDSLRMATLSSPYSENTNEYGKLVYAMQRVFIATETCGLVIHHMNKSGGKDQKKASLIESVAGHTSISAATSGLIGITSEKTEQGNLITLRTLPRDGSPLTLNYQIQNEDSGLLKLKKIWEDTAISNPSTPKILRFLEINKDTRYTSIELAKELNDRKLDAEFKESLTYLQSSQIVKSKYIDKKLYYWLDDDTVWVAQPKTMKDIVSSTILDANSMLNCRTKQELVNLTEDWEYVRRHSAISALLPDEKIRLGQLANSYVFEVGDVVVYEGNTYTVEERSEKATLLHTKYKLTGDIEVSEQDILAYKQSINTEPEEEEVIEEEDLVIFDDDIDFDYDEDGDELEEE